MSATHPAFETAIRNPDNPDHMMILKPVGRRVRIKVGDTVLADTDKAVRLIEIGKAVYDPLIYVPAGEIAVETARSDKETFCPLKGKAAYLELNGQEIGWTYSEPFEFAADIRDLCAFWPDKVSVREG